MIDSSECRFFFLSDCSLAHTHTMRAKNIKFIGCHKQRAHVRFCPSERSIPCRNFNSNQIEPNWIWNDTFNVFKSHCIRCIVCGGICMGNSWKYTHTHIAEIWIQRIVIIVCPIVCAVFRHTYLLFSRSKWRWLLWVCFFSYFFVFVVISV